MFRTKLTLPVQKPGLRGDITCGVWPPNTYLRDDSLLPGTQRG